MDNGKLKITRSQVIVSKVTNLFLAAIICINVIRHIFKADSQIFSFTVYGFYILFSALNFVISNKYFKKCKFSRDYIFYILFILFATYCTFYSLLFDIDTIMIAIKMWIYVAILFFTLFLSRSDLIDVLKFTVLINVIYSLLLVTQFRSINDYGLDSDMNYLNLSLTLGLSITLVMIDLFSFFLYKRKKKKIFLADLLLILILFLGINQFSARSTFIFPIFTLMLFLICIGLFDIKKFMKIIVPLFVFVCVGFTLFMKFTDAYTLSRMSSLFNNLEGEDRLFIWNSCFEIIRKEHLYFFGGGINRFENQIGFYPHNIVIQFVGEIGIIGLVLMIYTICFLILNSIKFLKLSVIHYRVLGINIFIFIFSGTLYLFMNFMKSFSIYEALILYLFISFYINEVHYINDRKEKK